MPAGLTGEVQSGVGDQTDNSVSERGDFVCMPIAAIHKMDALC